eukprot:3826733-Ditylum_brightwellii.AAC.1
MVALRALWGLLASAQASDNMDGLGSASGIIDALLISMQTHINNPQIQQFGCGVLKCLASASAVNDNVDDGVSSGAIICIVNSMKTHQDCGDVQGWGLRALYSFCSSSDRNKDNFVQSDAFGGCGPSLIQRAIDSFRTKMDVQEWACQLYWCLSSNEKAADIILMNDTDVQSIIDAMQRHVKYGDAAFLTTACCGTLANLAIHMDQSHKRLLNEGGVATIINAMLSHQDSKEVQVEGCTALANLSAIRDVRMAVLQNGGVDSLLSAMYSFPDECVLQGEACRALRCICSDSDNAREFASLKRAISMIIKAMDRHRGSVIVQEMACGLFTNLVVIGESQAHIIANGGLDAVSTAMRSHPREKAIQVAFTSLLCYFSACKDGIGSISSSGVLNAVISAMHSNAESEEIQTDACCIFWNLLSNPRTHPAGFAGVRGVKYIVKAMQALPESIPVQTMACGALWSLVTGSLEAKDAVASVGGIDAILCAIAIHPHNIKILEVSCGVLANLSFVSEHAAAIVHGGGIFTVVESMRANTSSTLLLELGSLFLRNIAAAGSEFADEA